MCFLWNSKEFGVDEQDCATQIYHYKRHQHAYKINQFSATIHPFQARPKPYIQNPGSVLFPGQITGSDFFDPTLCPLILLTQTKPK